MGKSKFPRASSRAASVLMASMAFQLSGAARLPLLRVSDNHRFIVTQDGKPFFWLGDTAWELFHRLDRKEAERYLRNRARLRYTVIQAVALAELDGLNAPNPYGEKPLIDNDPARPNDKYFQHVDWVVAKANELGLYIGFLPTWGDKWNKKWGAGPEIFSPENARVYGEWLGRRYRDAGIVWILGGDRPIESPAHSAIVRAMAEGIRSGDGGKHVMTFHPTGGSGSSQYFHHDAWLDFNMRQNGHEPGYTGRYDMTRQDYGLEPPKPVLDGEPIYECHPVSFDAGRQGYSIAADVRRPLYWDLFGGACGHTYGHHSVWQFWAPPLDPVNGPIATWVDALDAPGAAQMRHGRALIESRPFLDRVPDDSVVVPDTQAANVPGAGRYRFVGTRDAGGAYVMIYCPVGRPFGVRMDAVSGKTVRAWWFNPRDGKAKRIGEFPNVGERTFSPPHPGEFLDWVLVLDDASKGFGPPGAPVGRDR